MNGIKTTIIILLCLITVSIPTFSMAADSSGDLTIKINGFPNSNGSAMIAVMNSSEAWQKGQEMAVAKMMQPISNNQAQAVFHLPYDWYAVSIYQDENNNDTLDTNFLGIPKEKYGFSNNAKGTFGKPGWEEVRFELKTPSQEIVIQLD